MPEVFNVTLFEQATEDGVVYGSKAVGEPPLMLAFSVREALRAAAGAFGPQGTASAASPPRRRPSSGRWRRPGRPQPRGRAPHRGGSPGERPALAGGG